MPSLTVTPRCSITAAILRRSSWPTAPCRIGLGRASRSRQHGGATSGLAKAPGRCRPKSTAKTAKRCGRLLGPRYHGPPQPGRWLLARGEVQPGVCPRVGGGAFAPGRRLARPRGPLGAPPSHHALAWLPFSGTTVMVRPAAGRIGEWTGLDPSACFGVSLFRHEIVGYKGHGLVKERVLHLR